MKNSIYLLIFLLGIFCSCTNRTKSDSSLFEDESFIHVNLDKENDVSMYDFFSEVEIIPLETTSNSLLTFLIGEPDKVIMNDENFYFLDEKLKAVIIFNKEGKFLKKMDYHGNGPGEYITVRDFNINRFNNNIEFLSPEGRYMNIYDSSEDTFIERLILPTDMPVVHLFHNLTPDIYVFFSTAGPVEMLFYSRKDNKVIRNGYNLPFWTRGNSFSPTRNPFYLYNDTLCFNQVHNGYVFSISPINYELEPRYFWNFGKYKSDFLSTIPEDEPAEFYWNLLKNISMNYPILFLVYKENLKYYFTRFNFKNRYYHLILDKVTKEHFLFEKFTEGGQMLAMCINEEAVYSFVPPSFLHLVINKSILDAKNKSIYDQLKDDDNPVILKYRFK